VGTLRTELDRFPSPEARRVAVARANGRAILSPWFLAASAVVFLAPLVAVVALLSPALPISRRLVIALASALALPIAVVGATLILRRRLRRSLWRELGEAGVPTCVRCGHDLSASKGRACPGCGTEPGA
jgi:uncharacterized membrane protein